MRSNNNTRVSLAFGVQTARSPSKYLLFFYPSNGFCNMIPKSNMPFFPLELHSDRQLGDCNVSSAPFFPSYFNSFPPLPLPFSLSIPPSPVSPSPYSISSMTLTSSVRKKNLKEKRKKKYDKPPTPPKMNEFYERMNATNERTKSQ